MKVDYNKIKKNTGLDFESFSDLYFYVEHHIEYLMTHNKNYTKEQMSRIDDLHEIIESIDIWNDESEENN